MNCEEYVGGWRNDEIPLNIQGDSEVIAKSTPNFDRTIKVTTRVVTYVEEDVNLLDHLNQHACEVYLSAETQSVEIRMPTRYQHYSHFVADIPINVVDVKWVKKAIQDERHHQIFERYIDYIQWREGFNNTVLKE